jgi:nitroimidazol reductase NimA-like FMN-containing flavoprotein (pyridoxamine 5'-phosphate oxidase superfamily)
LVADQNGNSLKTSRTTVRRLPDRGHYNREEIYAVLDAGFICHLGFVVDGQPFVVPTSYWRKGDDVYFHGSAASRMLRTLAEPVPVCFTATHVDGLVLARSAFHHSINYRSVVILGSAVPVIDKEEKSAALEDFVNYILPGRWPEIRWPDEQEMKATHVLRLPLAEASVKMRSGDPKDDETDLKMNVWAGVIPLRTVAGEPITAKDLKAAVAVPQYAREFSGRGVMRK